MAPEHPRGERTLGIVVVSGLMILFGLAEVATGITGSFLGVIAAHRTLAYTLASVTIGLFYTAAGFLVLAMRKWATGAAIGLLVSDIVGRITLVAVGLFPFTGVDAYSIVAGTVIAAVFAGYLGWHWDQFGEPARP